MRWNGLLIGLMFVCPVLATAQDVLIDVDVTKRQHAVSKYLTGACIEDVNHEIYGGIYSQMIFGESFQEPSTSSSVVGFRQFGGTWKVEDGVLQASGGEGPKLVFDSPTIQTGEVSVEVNLPGSGSGNAGLIVSNTDPGLGADRFSGYEIALDANDNKLIVGRHQNNFQLLQRLDCNVPTNRWIELKVNISADRLVIYVDSEQVTTVKDPNWLPAGQIGLRQWQRPALYRNLQVKTRDSVDKIAFKTRAQLQQVSGMWDAVTTETAIAEYSLQTNAPFLGQQSQQIEFQSGSGTVGLANRGLNRWGMTFVERKPYEGYLWLQSHQDAAVQVLLQNAAGDQTLASATIEISGGSEFRRYDFQMTPGGSTTDGRFLVQLTQPAKIQIGHAFLQPGSWGRYKDLPVRRDVVQSLIDQGISVLRYGGSMVDNPPDYRWKNMIGPRDLRRPYDGHWYDYSTNGWGMIDFLNLTEATGILGIPCFSIDETPQDMLDFLQYANGSANSEWGRKRAADGHAKPYQLEHIQLGNEESVNEDYWRRFQPIAEALWKQNPDLILIVGDFQFDQPIEDPFHFSGSPAGITSLETHQKILQLAKGYGAEVWFDTHMWTGGPEPTSSMDSFFTYVNALEKLAEGAKHKVVVFEFNANNHRQRRALSNAEMIGRIMRDGRIPIALSANCLQPDGQNDNGWDQGLLFLNSSSTWLQPPGYVTQMIAAVYQPWVVQSSFTVTKNEKQKSDIVSQLDVVATASADSDSAVVRLVNRSNQPLEVQINVAGLKASTGTAQLQTLAAGLQDHNTADQPLQVQPETRQLKYDSNGPLTMTVAPYSFSTVRLQ